MATSRARPGQSRDRRKDRLTRPEYEAFRRGLSELIEAAGMTQRGLSKQLGMPSSYINKIIVGSRPVELTEIIDIARALATEPSELFDKSFAKNLVNTIH